MRFLIDGGGAIPQVDAPAFDPAADEVSEAVTRLLQSLQTSAPAKDREVEARKRRERGARRLVEQ